MTELTIGKEKNVKNVETAERKTEEIDEIVSADRSIDAQVKEEPTTAVAASETNDVRTIPRISNKDDVTDSNLSKLEEEMVNEILKLKLKISTLISNIRETKTLCDKYDNQNQYLQDYVGSLMKSGEMK